MSQKPTKNKNPTVVQPPVVVQPGTPLSAPAVAAPSVAAPASVQSKKSKKKRRKSRKGSSSSSGSGSDSESSSDSGSDSDSGKKLMKQKIMSDQELAAAGQAIINAIVNFDKKTFSLLDFEGFQLMIFRNSLLSKWNDDIAEFASDLHMIFGIGFYRGTKPEKMMGRTGKKGAKMLKKLKRKYKLLDTAAGKNSNAVSAPRLSAAFPEVLAESLLAYFRAGLPMRDFGIMDRSCPAYMRFPGGAVFADSEQSLTLFINWSILFHKVTKKVDATDADKIQITRFAQLQYQSPLKQLIKAATWLELKKWV